MYELSLPTALSKSFRVAAYLAAATLILGGTMPADAAPAAGPYKRVAPEPVVSGITADEYNQRQTLLHGWLTSEMPAGTLDSPLVADLDARERKELLDRQADSKISPAVAGRTKSVDLVVSFSPQDAALLGLSPNRIGHGVLQATANGGFVWAMPVRSSGAMGLRVHVSAMNLPDGVNLYFFSPSGRAFGPYTKGGPNGDGDFWTHTVSGDEGVLLLRHDGPGGAAALQATKLRIADVGHVSPKDFGGALTESFCQFNASCIENAECQNFGAGSAGAHAQDAVALMQWISGAFIFTCSGGLVADTDPGSQRRLFLTAHHCISKGRDASNLEAHFAYTVPCGTSTCPAQTTQPGSVQVLGATILNSSTNGDHTLLELSGGDPLPSSAWFLGWNNTPIHNTTTALGRVSHPSWGPQAYSAQNVNPSAPTCTSLPRGQFLYSTDSFGATEGGSSGSPVWNGAGEIVGQLYGACGTNLNDVCDSAHNATVDGALAAYYGDVAAYLDPTPGGTETNCTDGIDNDLDGLTDCNDPDCSGDPACGGGGCTLGQVGDPCTNNSDCCSNSCKGKPGSKTCK